MTHRPRTAGPAALVALVLALVAACGSPGPTASPAAPTSPTSSSAPAATGAAPSQATSAAPSSAASPEASAAAVNCADMSAGASFSPAPINPGDPNAAPLAKIEAAVQAIRGITATTAVPRNTLDEAGLCAFLRQSINRKNPPEVIAATEKLYKQLGLLPADMSLEKTYLNLLGSQVVGFYDQRTKQMYVISATGTMGPAEQLTYAHEFDHALQDQKFNLQTVLGDAKDQGDRSLARLTLVEGDATLLMSLWAQQNLTAAQLVQIVSAAGPASQAALDAAPPILKETMLWPYTQGLSLTLGAYQTSASFAGVDALWKNPPDTTEQLLHPDKLASREPGVAVAFPSDFAKRLGSGWKLVTEDTLGELQMNILMRTGNPNAGADPAAGWGGDRVALVQGPNNATAAVVDTTWDTPDAASSASQQLKQLATVLQGQGKHASVLQPSDKRVVLVSADTDATLGAVANVLGLAG